MPLCQVVDLGFGDLHVRLTAELQYLDWHKTDLFVPLIPQHCREGGGSAGALWLFPLRSRG